MIVFLVSCESNYYPKPHGYFRIDFPEKSYQTFDSTYPYSFDFPVYANVKPNMQKGSELYWVDVSFPHFKGKLHISYKTINNNLPEYLEDTRKMVMKHIPKANGIENKMYANPGHQVYGLTYNINGVNAASPYQFYLTDSTTHFLQVQL